MTNKKNVLIGLSVAFGVPTVYALIMRYIFGSMDTWLEIMSVAFLFLLPTLVGYLVLVLSPVEKAKKKWYRMFAPWIPIALFSIITLVLSLEGFACWIMVLPLFLIASSIGGLIGGYLKTRDYSGKMQISLLVLLPFLIAPIENLVDSIPGTYKAYTSIDIEATPDIIWDEVTRVSEIEETDDKGYLTRFLGFPRPVEAVLNYEGVGAYREAKFTGGLTFHEEVKEYVDNEKMVFSISADPYNIPAATMDEHVLIGGKYFDVLNGTYELERLNDKVCRLHLYSHFELNTSFNFYASWWARWIMEDIQNNILQVEKKRAESENKRAK